MQRSKRQCFRNFKLFTPLVEYATAYLAVNVPISYGTTVRSFGNSDRTRYHSGAL